MDDNKIFRIALITTILGLSGMLLLADKVTTQELKIKSINNSMLDADITVEGLVTQIHKSKRSETYFLEITDGTDKIKAIIFPDKIMDIQNGGLNINSLNNHRIKITGKVSNYNRNLELILKDAESLKVVG